MRPAVEIHVPSGPTDRFNDLRHRFRVRVKRRPRGASHNKEIQSRPMDKSELISTMRDAHQRMAGAIERLPDERLLEPAMGSWTGKDLVAHMAWWHDHSALVIECLRAGRQPYDTTDSANSTDALNERTHREHLDDPAELARRTFNESFIRLLAALEPCTDEELFTVDRWPWLDGETLVETILWDTSRHYDAHRQPLERLSR
jgi:hypothetical protein